MDAANGQLVVRLNQWRVEISDEFDWDPGSWALIPGIGRVTHAEMLPCKCLATAGATTFGPSGRRSPTPRSLRRRRSRRETIEAVIRPRERSCCRRQRCRPTHQPGGPAELRPAGACPEAATGDVLARRTS